MSVIIFYFELSCRYSELSIDCGSFLAFRMYCRYFYKIKIDFTLLTHTAPVLAADNVEGEHSLRTLSASAAAAATTECASFRSVDNRQIQNNKRQTAGDILC